ncbi:MAG: stage 0 sporulation family protein [Bacilli bacterium]|nr:stage 0 sporulation family protein [Bacilli bacterium]MDD4282693.1 stage 0 sporulation family protein [Bacilli bacterium]MDD4718232.1 stage 0 sporulation family protein [Bacilli bacterium]
MIEVVGVTLKEGGKVYYFSPNNLQLKRNLTVIVNTDRGLQFGYLDTDVIEIEESKISTPLNIVVRIATKADYLKHQKNMADAHDAINICKELIKENNLKMKIISANFTFDRSQLQFYFLSDTRVDFRNLVKNLASIYKTRIELRQIGVRDKAKETGGLGQCGRPLCCKNFLTNLDNVTINMAKNQNLSLNPSKINGSCGRLLCCLKFEDENYEKCRKCLPKVGSKVKTEKGIGVVTSIDILNGKYKVNITDDGIIEMELNKHGSC